ncbi:Unknown protein, partial [Striga hermonthica]
DDLDRQSQASTYRDRRAPDKPRITLSTFTGSDPDAWLNRATQYFELNETDGTDCVRYAAYYLDGEANVWWQWLTRIYHKRQQIIIWDVFERELLTRFGTSDYHNYNEALTRIRQTGSLREYIREFERLACRVRDWPEDALVSAFIGGLKFDLAAEVRLERPDTMHDAMEVARRREDHLVATRRGRADTRIPDTRRAGPSQLPASARPAFNTRPAGSLVRQLSPEEVKRQREKGLCFKCEEKFTLGHQCKQAFVIEVANPDDKEATGTAGTRSAAGARGRAIKDRDAGALEATREAWGDSTSGTGIRDVRGTRGSGEDVRDVGSSGEGRATARKCGTSADDPIRAGVGMLGDGGYARERVGISGARATACACGGRARVLVPEGLGRRLLGYTVKQTF